MDTKDPRVGVVVGRFQVDELHDGHMRLLKLVSLTHENMLVLIGVRPAEPSDTNPLDFMDRRSTILEKFPKALVLPMLDRRDDKIWSRHVDILINATYGYGVGAVFHVPQRERKILRDLPDLPAVSTNPRPLSFQVKHRNSQDHSC